MCEASNVVCGIGYVVWERIALYHIPHTTYPCNSPLIQINLLFSCPCGNNFLCKGFPIMKTKSIGDNASPACQFFIKFDGTFFHHVGSKVQKDNICIADAGFESITPQEFHPASRKEDAQFAHHPNAKADFVASGTDARA